MTTFLTIVFFGIITGAVIAPAAVGFTLQFSATNVLNIAFGSQLSVGVFVAYALDSHGVSIWLSAAASIAASVVASFGLNRLLIQPFKRRGTSLFGMIVVTMGIDLVVLYVIEWIWGPSPLNYRLFQQSTITIDTIPIPMLDVIIVGISLAVMVLTQVLIRRTKLGKAMRATAANEHLARCSGIKVDRVVDAAWALSGALAGLAGIILALNDGGFSFTIGDSYLITIIAAAILGGIGDAYGAVIGAVLVGLMTQVGSELISPVYAQVWAFTALVIALILRPSGLFSRTAILRGVA
jgi:branched-subunit amino acid ABC-type transport system permease component